MGLEGVWHDWTTNSSDFFIIIILILALILNDSPTYDTQYYLNSPGKNTGMDCHSLLQEIFPIQGSTSGLPHCRFFTFWSTRKTHSFIQILWLLNKEITLLASMIHQLKISNITLKYNIIQTRICFCACHSIHLPNCAHTGRCIFIIIIY